MSLEARVREHLPRGWRRRLVRLSRLRWARKAAIARGYGASLRCDPLLVAGFVLLDPEVDTFTYELANDDELVAVTAAALGVPPARTAALLAEAKGDPRLRALDRRVRWRFDYKRRLLFGRRYVWYVLVRELRPALAVETGIKDGLGSVLLLRALERNAAEGHPGRLISFDLYPDKGWLVPGDMRAAWEPIFAPTTEALPAALAGEQVGLLVHDSDTTYATGRFEFETALAHAAPRLALVSGTAHHHTALADLCAERGVPYHHFDDRPRRHVSPGSSTGVGIFTR